MAICNSVQHGLGTVAAELTTAQVRMLSEVSSYLKLIMGRLS